MTDILKDARRNTTIENKKQRGNISSNDEATNSFLTSSDGKDYFSTLPEEIILMIFKFLPLRDIIKLVCQRWYDASFSSILWKKVSLKYEFISISFLKSILKRGTRILCCGKCKFGVPTDWSNFGKDRFDNLQTLSLEHTFIERETFENLLSLTSNLKVLNLTGHDHKSINCDFFRIIFKLKHLEELHLSSMMIIDISDITENCESNLCCLRFNEVSFENKFRNFERFISHCSQLTHCALNNSNLNFNLNFKKISELKKLEHLEIQSCLTLNEQFDPSDCTNRFCSLRFLILKRCHFFDQRTIRNLLMCCSQLIHLSVFDDTLDLVDKDIELILEMENLEHLEIDCFMFQTTGLTPAYHKRLRKLRYLKISCEGKSMVTDFLSLCKNLTELHLMNVFMDNVPSSITQMKELHMLSIKSEEKITPSQIQSILRVCPKLNVI